MAVAAPHGEAERGRARPNQARCSGPPGARRRTCCCVLTLWTTVEPQPETRPQTISTHSPPETSLPWSHTRRMLPLIIINSKGIPSDYHLNIICDK